MPIAFTVTGILCPIRHETTLPTPTHLHGAFFELMKRASPQMAHEIHDQPVKPFTLALVPIARRDRQRPSESEALTFRVTLLKDELYPPLSQCFLVEKMPQLILGDQRLTISEIRGPCPSVAVKSV